jgi:hypothetical protein
LFFDHNPKLSSHKSIATSKDDVHESHDQQTFFAKSEQSPYCLSQTMKSRVVGIGTVLNANTRRY